MSVLAHEIMTPTIKAVHHNWTMDRLARFLTDNEITGSPVTDDNGDIIDEGLLLQFDANLRLEPKHLPHSPERRSY